MGEGICICTWSGSQRTTRMGCRIHDSLVRTPRVPASADLSGAGIGKNSSREGAEAQRDGAKVVGSFCSDNFSAAGNALHPLRAAAPAAPAPPPALATGAGAGFSQQSVLGDIPSGPLWRIEQARNFGQFRNQFWVSGFALGFWLDLPSLEALHSVTQRALNDHAKGGQA